MICDLRPCTRTSCVVNARLLGGILGPEAALNGRFSLADLPVDMLLVVATAAMAPSASTPTAVKDFMAAVRSLSALCG